MVDGWELKAETMKREQKSEISGQKSEERATSREQR